MEKIIFLTLMFCLSCSSGDTKKDQCAILKEIKIGTAHEKVENLLNLGNPVNTFMGSSLYHDRVFEYVVDSVTVIKLGFQQVGKDSNYSTGEFLFNGDYSLSNRDSIVCVNWRESTK